MNLDLFGLAGDAYGLWLLRVVIALVILYHAAPKLEQPRQIGKIWKMRPGTIVFLGTLEILAAYALIFGYHLELASAVLIVIGLGAMLAKITHWETPFSSATSTGWELELLMVAGLLAILLTNGGTIKLAY